ncbi:cupin domain-containing protein [Deinococcus roseus]|uniref:Cupin 2 conserved barrel domain-containing protein n=1 Tax=Deinococcus roseus TaxID=392414 RepID=A0ABQ2CZA4_9DEIO|nr:hypothetical protein [Deinococcus roseus]GGJ35495.1 hypothetical protein GCM10008938_21990 [Deinococcus roseus]
MEKIEKTGVIAQNAGCKIVRKVLRKGQEMPRHDHPGEQVLISMTSGTLLCNFDDGVALLAEGDVVQFEGERFVTLQAQEENTTFLVMLLKR